MGPGCSSPLRRRWGEPDSWDLRQYRRAEVNTVEQQLERAVRLRAERYFRREHEQAALPDRRLCELHAIRQVLLTPRPPAAKRVGSKRSERLETGRRSIL